MIRCKEVAELMASDQLSQQRWVRRVEVRFHLWRCRNCSRFRKQIVQIGETARKVFRESSRVKDHGVGESLEARLLTSLLGETSDVAKRPQFSPSAMSWMTPFGVKGWALSFAAILMLVLGIPSTLWYLGLRADRTKLMAALNLGVQDHLQCAIKGHNYPEIANPPDRLREQLGPQYAGLLPVVEKKLSGFQVLEAHICSVPGSPRKYVHFIARGQGTIVSVILTKQDGESLPAGRFLVARSSGGVDLYKAKFQDTDVAGFETNGYFGFVVSNLGQDQMVQLAASLAPGVRNALGESIRSEKAAAPAVLIGFVSFGSSLRSQKDKREYL